MKEVVFFLWSGIGCVCDLRNRTVPRCWLLVGAVLDIGIAMWTKMQLLNCVMGLFPGMLLLLFSKMTGGKVGRGDGFYLLILGSCFGAVQGCLTLFCGIFLATLFSTVGIFSGRIHFRSRLPLIPFLFLGFEMLKLF